MIVIDINEANKAEELFNRLELFDHDYRDLVSELRNIFQPIMDNERAKQIRLKHVKRFSYAKFDPMQKMSQVIGTLNTFIAHYEEALDNLEQTQKSQSDILHAIELLDLDSDEMMHMVRDLKIVRTLRRESKDFVALAEPAYTYMVKLKTNGILKELALIDKEIKDKAEKMQDRGYYPRVMVELSQRFQEAKEESDGHL